MEQFVRGREIATIDVALCTIVDSNGREIGFKTSSKIGVNAVTKTLDANQLMIKGICAAQKKAQTTVVGHTIVLNDNVFIPEVVQILQGGVIVFSKDYGYSASGVVAAGAKYIHIDADYLAFSLTSALASGDTLSYNDVTGVLTLVAGGVTSHPDYTVSATVPASGTEIVVVGVANEDYIRSYTPPVSGEAYEPEIFTLCAYSTIYDAAGIVKGFEKITYPNCTGSPVAFSSEDNVFRVPEYTINSAPNSGQAPYAMDYVPRLPVEAV
jgi:hypothetical protein